MKKSVKKNTSVQVSQHIHDEIKKFCDKRGYKLSKFLEILAENHISGSMEEKSRKLIQG